MNAASQVPCLKLTDIVDTGISDDYGDHLCPKPPLDREAKRGLAVIRHVEEVSGNVALTCRYLGFSRQAYYSLYWRYQADGVGGARGRGILGPS